MNISQREARRLVKRVAVLERALSRQRREWSQEYFGAVQIGAVSFDGPSTIPAVIRTARKLGHAVVVVGDETLSVRIMALPHPNEPL